MQSQGLASSGRALVDARMTSGDELGAAPVGGGAVPQTAAAGDVLDTPTAGRKVIHGGVFRTFGYGAGLVFGLVSASLLTRHLGVVDWGHYVTVTSLLAIVGGLSDAGMSSIG